MRVFVRGDLLANNDTELYSTDDLMTADQDPLMSRVEDVPTGGDVQDVVIRP